MKKHSREEKLVGIPRMSDVRPYGLGVDVAKDFHAVCLLIPKGNQVQQLEFECSNTPRAMRMAKTRICNALARANVEFGNFTYACESTATYHCPLIRTWGGRPCVINPALACAFKARKTDRLDAYKMAVQQLQGLWTASVPPTNEIEVLRLLTRTRRRLIASRGRYINSITTRLWQWNCASTKLTARNKLVRAVIEDLAAGRKVTPMEQFEGHRHVPNIVWRVCVQLYTLADAVDFQLLSLDADLKQRIKGELFDRLLLIPGVGPVVAATWMAEVEPATRFPKAGHVTAYCGLDPTPMISGGKQVGSKLRMGNSHIRWSLVQAGAVLLNGSSKLAAKFGQRPGPYKKKVCMAARHIAHLMFKASTEGMEYDEEQVHIGSGKDDPDRPDSPGECGKAVA